MSRRGFEQVAAGDALPAVTRRVTRADLVRYAGASGDFNPIHWNERTARGVGLPDVIAHGMYSMALAGRLVSDWAGDPGAVRSLTTRFTAPVPVPDDDHGTEVEVGGTVVSLDESARTAAVDLVVTFAGAAVLGRARAVVALA